MVVLIIWGFLAPILAFFFGFLIGVQADTFKRFFGNESNK